MKAKYLFYTKMFVFNTEFFGFFLKRPENKSAVTLKITVIIIEFTNIQYYSSLMYINYIHELFVIVKNNNIKINLIFQI